MLDDLLKGIKIKLLFIIYFLFASLLFSQVKDKELEDRLHLIQKSDFSIRTDGKYQGMLHLNALASLLITKTKNESNEDASQNFLGEFSVLQGSVREAIKLSKLDRVAKIGAMFSLENGLDLYIEEGLPFLRSIPAKLPKSIDPNKSWISESYYAFDPFLNSIYVLLPIYIQYKFDSEVLLDNQKALLIKASFAINASKDGLVDFTGDSKAAKVKDIYKTIYGKHNLDIWLNAETYMPIRIIDKYQDEFVLQSDSKSNTRQGFDILFFKFATSINKDNAENLIVKTIKENYPTKEKAETSLESNEGIEKANIEFVKSRDGLVLRLNDFKFEADSEKISDSEVWKLKALANALKSIKSFKILVAGHAADTGRKDAEMDLSTLRAANVASELAKLGINSEDLIYKGYGSTRPLFPNDTEISRAKNRRVEITLLD